MVIGARVVHFAACSESARRARSVHCRRIQPDTGVGRLVKVEWRLIQGIDVHSHSPSPRARALPQPGQITLPTMTSKIFDIVCSLGYTPAGTTDFTFLIHALHGMDQEVLTESLVLTPDVRQHLYEDPLLHHRFLRVQAAAGPLQLHYRARVQMTRPEPDQNAVEHPVAELPDEVLAHLMATRYCESDLLGPAAIKMFGTLAPGWQRVQAICDWIHTHIDYRLGSSNTTTTARDVFVARAGVCRDLAHLGVTFCRALNIPARLVVGYAVFRDPPPDFHAIFEAYLGGRWQLFDATRMSPPQELVRIAVGRDAKDVAFATIFGQAVSDQLLPCVAPATASTGG